MSGWVDDYAAESIKANGSDTLLFLFAASSTTVSVLLSSEFHSYQQDLNVYSGNRCRPFSP